MGNVIDKVADVCKELFAGGEVERIGALGYPIRAKVI